jgi:hypothetical protein
VILFSRDYDAFAQEIAREQRDGVRLPVAFELQDDMVLLMPGPFEVCGRAAIAGTVRNISYTPKNETPR